MEELVAEAAENQLWNACLVELMKKKQKNMTIGCSVVVVVGPVVISRVVSLNWWQYWLHRPPWHHLRRQARPKGTPREPPCHRHLRQSEVDLVCDLQGRATTLSTQGPSRLAATLGRLGVPFGLFPGVQAEDAACLGAGRPLVPPGEIS